MKQKTAAAAFMHQPDILILDEPTHRAGPFDADTLSSF